MSFHPLPPPLDRPPKNNNSNITRSLPLDRDIPKQNAAGDSHADETTIRIIALTLIQQNVAHD